MRLRIETGNQVPPKSKGTGQTPSLLAGTLKD
jgi:hypothetical protein